MDADFIRNRITQLRLQKGVSEYQMSYDLGHSRSYMYNISSGIALPPMLEFLQICEYFGITQMCIRDSFFGLLKSELFYLQEFKSMEHFRQELIEYLDYYNNRRIKANLKGLPPAIHRLQALSAA